MRTYLVVIDESRESEIAMRFAARRAVKTGGGIEILALLPTPEFVQWGGVMATMEEEARQRAEATGALDRFLAGRAGRHSHSVSSHRSGRHSQRARL